MRNWPCFCQRNVWFRNTARLTGPELNQPFLRAIAAGPNCAMSPAVHAGPVLKPALLARWNDLRRGERRRSIWANVFFAAPAPKPARMAPSPLAMITGWRPDAGKSLSRGPRRPLLASRSRLPGTFCAKKEFSAVLSSCARFPPAAAMPARRIAMCWAPWFMTLAVLAWSLPLLRAMPMPLS